jgi:ribosome-binding protein aMBF1 (putative translation factor)
MVFRDKKTQKVCKLKNNVYFCTPNQVINKKGVVMENVFAQRLINARRIRGISQRELCTRLGGRISSNAIAKYETAKMIPSSQT